MTQKKLLRPTNTDGWGNKLITIFAHHLDCFIMTQNLISVNRDLEPSRLFYRDPTLNVHLPVPIAIGMAKNAAPRHSSQAQGRLTPTH